jgi:ubiquinone/menaquinone biosynthesis C-methylase UbiE
MTAEIIAPENKFLAVNKAFSKQSEKFDDFDMSNPVLQDMRRQIYQHINEYLKPGSHILELNAGTGIDALYLATLGHTVHATDLSDGMVRQIKKKIFDENRGNSISVQQLSYDQLNLVRERDFNYVFSNFGGLNCIASLKNVTKHLPLLLLPGGRVTWVIMPPVCIWEMMAALSGNFKHAFRRFTSDGVVAHLEGEQFKTYYHSLRDIIESFGPDFKLIRAEGLGAVSPQPHHTRFVTSYPRLYKWLRSLDARVRHSFPFNRWADHLIVTMQYKG